MNDFFETARQFVLFSPETTTAFSAILKRLQLPKGHLLVKQDTVCNYIYYVEKGLCRTFYYKDGKDVTDWISTERTFSCSIVSFISRTPDRRNIELLEDSILWALKYDDVEQLCKTCHEAEHFVRLLTSYGMIQVQQRFDDLHFAPAAERYSKLISTNPTILQRVPLGMVASYLGITPETLSRIRSQYALQQGRDPAVF
jgi:CRP-like cAMP-binding protein